MDLDAFVARFPRLWHMAELEARDQIETRGLLSTSALLDLFEVSGERRRQLESRHRPDSVRICHPIHGVAVIRDQKPLIEKVLLRTLVGMTPREWYETLNSRVFFWLDRERLRRMRNAPPYRHRQHTILTVDTRTLFERHYDRITLSPINSGATHPGATVARGKGTFRRFSEYPWQERLKSHPREPVVEVAVDYSVPDIADCIIEIRTC